MFYFAPTALGHQHLRSCEHTGDLRRQVWQLNVPRDEVPVG